MSKALSMGLGLTLCFVLAIGLGVLLDRCDTRSTECRSRVFAACLEAHGTECSVTVARVCSMGGR